MEYFFWAVVLLAFSVPIGCWVEKEIRRRRKCKMCDHKVRADLTDVSSCGPNSIRATAIRYVCRNPECGHIHFEVEG